MIIRSVPPRFISLLLLCLLAVGVNSRPSAQESASGHFKFQWVGSGKTMKKGGVEVSFGRFRSEGGVLVERFVEDYRTQEAALNELEKLRRQAAKVNGDSYKKDFQGKQVGRRVDLLFPRSARKPEHTVVAWADGSRVFLLRSESRPVLLDFEQQDYPAAPARNTPKKPTPPVGSEGPPRNL